MPKQIELPESARALEIVDGLLHEVCPDVAYVRTGIVNAVMCGYRDAGDRRWILIDTGLVGWRGAIEEAAERRFGDGARPWAIVLTHGHFDHVGSVERLAAKWDVPVFAHREELPFLDGRLSYPPPNAGVRGLMARLSPMLPRGPIDLGRHLRELPGDGSIPGMPGWEWVHTPGHTPGHVSLWRQEDGTLIVGDAFVTTRQESLYSAVTQRPEMHGPPMYFTPDWASAASSVRRLAHLRPSRVVTGHGRAMQGPAMRAALEELAREFEVVAVPRE